MKVAEITTYKEGGAYTHVIELIKGLNIDNIIVTGNTKKFGFEHENGYVFYHIPKLRSIWDVFFINKPGSYKELEDLFKEKQVNIVHFHSPLFTFLYGFLKKKKFPTIMTVHYLLEIKTKNKRTAFVYQNFIRWMTKYIAKNVDKIICVNEEYIPVFKKWGIEPKKLIFIPNGVDTKRFSPGKSKIKEKYDNQKIILYFGRIHYQKNVELLVNSFPLIKQKMNNVKLIIIGTGNQYDKLKNITKDDPDITMTGFVPDDTLVDYMRAADVVVFPSRGENASLTIMEAMACELPVVSSDVGNAKKILGDNRGILLEKYTDEEIAEICLDVLTDEKKAVKIGKIARKYVEQYHSWEIISKKIEDLYKQVIKDKKRA